MYQRWLVSRLKIRYVRYIRLLRAPETQQFIAFVIEGFFYIHKINIWAKPWRPCHDYNDPLFLAQYDLTGCLVNTCVQFRCRSSCPRVRVGSVSSHRSCSVGAFSSTSQQSRFESNPTGLLSRPRWSERAIVRASASVCKRETVIERCLCCGTHYRKNNAQRADKK